MLITVGPAFTLHVAPIEWPNAAERRWSTTGTVTNYNSSNGTYSGGGRGMSKHYTLNADGTFKQDSLIEIMNSTHRMSAFITPEGRYEVRGDNIRFKVLNGHQHGKNNITSAGNDDRTMSVDVVRKISETYRFTMRTENGKRALVLLLGKSPKDDVIYFPAPRGR